MICYFSYSYFDNVSEESEKKSNQYTRTLYTQLGMRQKSHHNVVFSPQYMW